MDSCCTWNLVRTNPSMPTAAKHPENIHINVIFFVVFIEIKEILTPKHLPSVQKIVAHTKPCNGLGLAQSISSRFNLFCINNRGAKASARTTSLDRTWHAKKEQPLTYRKKRLLFFSTPKCLFPDRAVGPSCFRPRYVFFSTSIFFRPRDEA